MAITEDLGSSPSGQVLVGLLGLSLLAGVLDGQEKRLAVRGEDRACDLRPHRTAGELVDFS